MMEMDVLYESKKGRKILGIAVLTFVLALGVSLPVLADAPDVTAYSSWITDIGTAVTGAIPTILTAIAPLAAGVMVLGLGYALLRRFAR